MDYAGGPIWSQESCREPRPAADRRWCDEGSGHPTGSEGGKGPQTKGHRQHERPERRGLAPPLGTPRVRSLSGPGGLTTLDAADIGAILRAVLLGAPPACTPRCQEHLPLTDPHACFRQSKTAPDVTGVLRGVKSSLRRTPACATTAGSRGLTTYQQSALGGCAPASHSARARLPGGAWDVLGVGAGRPRPRPRTVTSPCQDRTRLCRRNSRTTVIFLKLT